MYYKLIKTTKLYKKAGMLITKSTHELLPKTHQLLFKSVTEKEVYGSPKKESNNFYQDYAGDELANDVPNWDLDEEEEDYEAEEEEENEVVEEIMPPFRGGAGRGYNLNVPPMTPEEAIQAPFQGGFDIDHFNNLYERMRQVNMNNPIPAEIARFNPNVPNQDDDQ